MICTSEGDVFSPDDFPKCMFTKRLRSKTYVVYNLKYDEGALVQRLPYENLQELRSNNFTEHEGYKYTCIPKKMFKVSHNRRAVTFYDISSFFKTSLDNAARELLNETKDNIETKDFSFEYVLKNYDRIAKYCIKDALLTKKLAECLIRRFESFGVYPKKLYSTAYVSYQYFKSKCDYPVVIRFWNYYKKLLDYSLKSYNGGKFEVTTKGHGYYYEYDVSSQYPAQICNLIDVTDAEIIYSKKYIKKAQYGFIKCHIDIPLDVNSPVALKNKYVNIYPSGTYTKIITKQEYDYLTSRGCKVEIIDGWYLYVRKPTYPFRDEVNRLYELKNKIKNTDKKLDYYIIKILLNSLYGKFCQLIDKKEYYQASTCWNPIYAAIITANGRIQVSNAQNMYKSVVAVHTDSVISTKKLPIDSLSGLGQFEYVTEGYGLILGSGVYQIGDKTKFRGFSLKKPLVEIINDNKNKGKVIIKRPLSWREVVFHGWPAHDINLFKQINKFLKVDFDTKRIWIDDWECFEDVNKYNVNSIPLYIDDVLD